MARVSFPFYNPHYNSEAEMIFLFSCVMVDTDKWNEIIIRVLEIIDDAKTR